MPSRGTIFAQVACFPITRGTPQARILEQFDGRAYLLEMHDETTSNSAIAGESILY